MRVSTLLPTAFLGLVTLSTASPHLTTGAKHHVQVERSTPGAVTLHHNEERTFGLLCGLLGGLFGGCRQPAPRPVYVAPRPDYNWKCRGDGRDGWDVDWNGNGLPGGYPAGWRFFGASIGWHPPYGWNGGDNWSPPAPWFQNAHLATWFAPESSWIYPESFLSFIPDFWYTQLGWHSYRGPAYNFNTRGDGRDGFDFDYRGRGSPYNGLGFKFFGVSHGWLPALGWEPTTPDWAAPPTCNLNLAPWWTSNSQWWKKHNNGGNHGGDHGEGDDHDDDGHGNGNWPANGWNSDGHGEDGMNFDYIGHACPYPSLSGHFKFFGSSFGNGWHPVKGFRPSDDWTPPSQWVPSYATWFVPQSSWRYPSNFAYPSFWLKNNWTPYKWAPVNFVCNGKGTDGYDFDHRGRSRPSGFPVGFRYYGAGPGWQPSASFNLPSPSWRPPTAWSPRFAPWWQPRSTWTVQNRYACPRWWPKSFLRGSFIWL